MKYVSLHHHSTYSYMDGYGNPDLHVKRAAELEQSALFLTEHGNVSSHVKLEKAAEEAGIKAGFGCEIYTASEQTRYKWHLTVLAMNEVGYRNLLQMVSRSWAEGFYQWPTVSGEMLADHNEGLIVLSGCADSKLACDLLGGKGVEPHSADLRTARQTAQRFQDLFGDRYYLECQRFPELERTRTLNPVMEQLSQDLGIPLVATADCHYPDPDDNEMQKILHAAGRNIGSVSAAEASWEYDIRLTHPISDKEIYKQLLGTGLSRKAAEAAIYATAEIADRCDVTLPKAERLRYPAEDSVELAWEWLREGWRYRGFNRLPKEKQREWGERVKYEMDMFIDKDFVDYFLMLSDTVRTAKDNGVPVGPARGSAAASLCCYLWRITEVNPMLFPTMVFERFIDPTRMDLPDVDLDFDDERREFIRQHLIRRYGADHVGNIGNFVKYRGKNAVVDVCRVYNIPKFAEETVKSLVIERSGGDSRFDASLEDTFEMFPKAKEQLEKFPALANAVRLEGNMKGMSIHAAGLVVSNTPITDFCALYERTVKKGKQERKVNVLSVDKYDGEHLNLLKVDVLGLSTMGMIRIALELIDMPLTALYDIPMDDADTLAVFKAGDVVGVFQFEGRATRLVNNDVSPDNFMELADINALSRPGPLFSGATAAYVDTKHGRIPRMKFHPLVDKLTKHTHGQIVYQEQILQIVREVGGFPWTHAAAIRKIISQKKGEAAFNAMQDQFVEGAERLHDIDRELALRIWKQLVTSGTYAFNVAHCISYSMLAFWTMWLKVHHPLEFYTAQLRKTEKEKWPRLLRDAARHGVKVLPPDLNASVGTWTPDRSRNAVLAGFEQIDGIGESYTDAILATREEMGGFDNWDDLIKVKGIGPAKMRGIKAFCESDDPFGLEVTGRILREVREAIANDAPGFTGLPKPTHTSDQIPPDATNLRVVFLGVPRAKNYQDFIENQRARTGEEVSEIVAHMKDKDKVTSCVVHAYDDGEEDVYLRFNRFVFPRFKTALEDMRVGKKPDLVLAIGKKKSGFGIAVHVEHMWVIDLSDEDEEESADEDA